MCHSLDLQEFFIYSLQICVLKHQVASLIGHGKTDWFQIGKGVRQGCILSPCLYNLYAEYIMQNPGLDKTGIKTAGEISTASDMQMTPPFWQKVKKN